MYLLCYKMYLFLEPENKRGVGFAPHHLSIAGESKKC